MPLDYTGDDTATQAPSPLPAKSATPIFRLPVDGEAANVASIYQPFKAAADAVDAFFDRGAWIDAANTWTAQQTHDMSDENVAARVSVEPTTRVLLETLPLTGTTGAAHIYHAAGLEFVSNATWANGGALWTQTDVGIDSWMQRFDSASGLISFYRKAAGSGPTWADGAWTQIAYIGSGGLVATFLQATNDVTASAGAVSAATTVTAGTSVTAGTKMVTANASLNHGSGSSTVRDITGNGGKVIGYEIFGSTQTTDAVTTQTAITFAMPADKAVAIQTTVTAVKSDWTLAYRHQTIDCYYKTGAGAPTQTAGGTQDVSAEDAATISPALKGWSVSGNNLVYQIQGDPATTINWMVKAEITMIG